MTSSPPRLASWALALLLPHADRDLVLGDLWEESHRHVVPAHGARRARWWYWRQVVTSIIPLVSRSWEAANAGRVTVASLVMLLSIAPSCVLITVRGFALSQVPLKTTAEPSVLFLVVLTLCTVACVVAGVRCAFGVLSGGSAWPK